MAREWEERWEATRKRGMLRFVIVQGVVMWGGSMTILFLFLAHFFFRYAASSGIPLQAVEHQRQVTYTWLPMLMLPLGAVWGVGTWYLTALWVGFKRRRPSA